MSSSRAVLGAGGLVPALLVKGLVGLLEDTFPTEASVRSASFRNVSMTSLPSFHKAYSLYIGVPHSLKIPIKMNYFCFQTSPFIIRINL